MTSYGRSAVATIRWWQLNVSGTTEASNGRFWGGRGELTKLETIKLVIKLADMIEQNAQQSPKVAHLYVSNSIFEAYIHSDFYTLRLLRL